jgi:hypothetical protein
MINVKDWRDNPIKVGSNIVYSVRNGSSMKLVEAIVTDVGRTGGPLYTFVLVKPVRSSCSWDTDFSKPRRLTALDNITVMA